MSERDTPETDAAAYSTTYNNGTWAGGKRQVVNSNFARRLERQRDELAEALREVVAFWDAITMEDCVNDLHVKCRSLLARIDKERTL